MIGDTTRVTEEEAVAVKDAGVVTDSPLSYASLLHDAR